jgi:uncharacterized protein YbaR (Trm112 family)
MKLSSPAPRSPSSCITAFSPRLRAGARTSSAPAARPRPSMRAGARPAPAPPAPRARGPGPPLMPRGLALDVLACPRCGGRLRVLATVQTPRAVQAILASLARSGAPAPPGPAPPAPAALTSPAPQCRSRRCPRPPTPHPAARPLTTTPRRRRIPGGSGRSRCRPSPSPPRNGRCESAAGSARTWSDAPCPSGDGVSRPYAPSVTTPVSRRFDGWVSASVGLAALEGRRIDGAPTLRIPSCAGERNRLPLMSANRRLTKPRETGRDACAINGDHNTAGRDITS